MASDGGPHVWPREPGGRLAGWLELQLAGASTTPVPFDVKLPSGDRLELTIPPRTPKLVRIPVCGRGVLDRELGERQRRRRPRHPRRRSFLGAAARRSPSRVPLGRPERLVFL